MSASTWTSTKSSGATDWPVPPGWTLHYLPTTGSTNDDARSLALAGCPDRTVVLADEQRAGRGRLGRRWIAPRGASLLLSIVLRRKTPSVFLTALCSLGVVEAIAETTGLTARIKWPNDVMIGPKKVCGILTEVLSRDDQAMTVVGIGLNVNLEPMVAGIPESGTSLSLELGRDVERATLFGVLLARLDAALALADRSFEDAIRGRWEALLWRRSQAVRVDQDGPTLYGVVEGLTSSGALRLRAPDGELIEVAIGDVIGL